MFVRNRTGGAEFPSIGISGANMPSGVAARMRHAFAPLFGPTHYHSRHAPAGFENSRGYAVAASALGSINLPLNLTGWQRVFIRVKGVIQMWPERDLYEWVRIDDIWDEALGPVFWLGGAGIYGDQNPPTVSIRNQFGEASDEIYNAPLHDVTNIIANYGDDSTVVQVIDRMVEFSMNMSQGRQIVFGGYAGNAALMNILSSGFTFWTGGTMPDGLFVGNGTNAELGTPFPAANQVPGGFFIQNPGLNPASLAPPGDAMFSTNIANTHQLIGQFYGSRQQSTPSDPVVTDY